MRKLYILLHILVILLMGSVVSGATINTFNNSLLTENLEFSGNENITRWLDVDAVAVISSAVINFSSNFTRDCTQVDATINNASCTVTNDTGNYDGSGAGSDNGHDGDWTSYYWNNFHFVNYSIPSGASNCTWKIKDDVSTRYIDQCGKDCWGDNGMVAFYVHEQTGGNTASWYCHNKTSASLVLVSQEGSGQYIYEEAIIWNYTNNITNPFLEVGTTDNSHEWNHTGSFIQNNNKTEDFASGVTSALNGGACDCTNCSLSGTTCTIPFTFHSDSAGELQYDGLSVVTDTLNVDNCTSEPNIFINFSIIDESYVENGSLINGDIDYYFNYTADNINYYTYNGSEFSSTPAGNYINSSDFCYNANYTFYSDIVVTYTADGFNTRTYIVENASFNTTITQTDLYLLSTGLSTDITINVVDDSDNNLANVLIEAYRWDIPTNQDILVETEKTDTDGNALFNLNQGDVYYSFKLYRDNVLVLETNRFKIFSTTLSYTIITTSTSVLSEWLDMQSITSSLSYDNSTRLVTFSFTDNSGVADDFCLNITDTNGTNIVSNCSINSSLTFTVNNNVSYVAVGLARYPDSLRYYVLETLDIYSKTTFRDWIGFENALTIGMIIFLTIALLALVNKNVAMAGAITGVFILYFFGIIQGKTILMGIIGIGALGMIIMNLRKE